MEGNKMPEELEQLVINGGNLLNKKGEKVDVTLLDDGLVILNENDLNNLVPGTIMRNNVLIPLKADAYVVGQGIADPRSRAISKGGINYPVHFYQKEE